MRAVSLVLCLSVAVVGMAAPSANVTYSKDVASILNSRCVGCHRAGEAAPMAFTSYQQVRPWAKAIREAVVSRKMPPWLADPHVGKFSNDRRLTDDELATVKTWVDAGSPEGDPKALPPPPAFVEGWNIGKPDVVLNIGADFEVPTTGVVPYKYFTVDTGFTEDMWIEAAECRADKRAVVHHIIVFVVDPTEPRLAGTGGNLLVGWAPGDPPMNLPEGTAKLVRAGSKLRFQMHYTPNGTGATDRSYVGLRFARKPPRYRALTGRAINFSFKIPPGDPSHEVKASWTGQEEVRLTSLMPHMHVRGKDFKYTLVLPDGTEKVLLNVPRYDFNWQLGYSLADPLILPKGSRLDCVAHFDNSPNNKSNPDPTKEVRWGDQTWEEMMIGWFNYTVDAQTVQVSKAGNE